MLKLCLINFASFHGQIMDNFTKEVQVFYSTKLENGLIEIDWTNTVTRLFSVNLFLLVTNVVFYGWA